jgi:hypothetical protein
MALNKLKFNSLNVTPTAGKAIGFNSSADGLEATLSGGAMTFIKKLTASSSGTLSFVDGASDVVLDNTYKEYVFIFTNIHPEQDNRDIRFNASTDSGSNYNVTKTTTFFNAFHNEGDSDTSLQYEAGNDLSQSTAFINLTRPVGNDNDQCTGGILHLFNPSSTTFVKHYIARFASSYEGDYIMDEFTAGYFNTTSAVDAVQFKMGAGDIDAGTITLYGIN